MPFVAPEVLKGKPYTQAADIYSFVLKICNGIRPEINEKEAPKCYIDLMKREDEKIEKQFEEAEEYRKANLLSVKNSKLTTQHPQAYYTSRLLNPFTKDLSKYDNINNNSVEIIDFMKISIEDENKDKQSEEKSKV
ncbi:unnamed protein product [Rhizophagus irregularis]|nr:unnamed protein product [Rhizophagus irregularis]